MRIIELEGTAGQLVQITLNSGLTNPIFFNGLGLFTLRRFYVKFSYQWCGTYKHPLKLSRQLFGETLYFSLNNLLNNE